MYPRNAASPPTIALGQILLLADGAIQTSGASVRVKTGASAWGAGAGTLDCDATSGEWTYTPSQAETNDPFFLVVVYKASCTSQSQTIITSASATAGYAGLDWSKITAPTTTVGLSGTTIKTATDIEADTVDIQSRLPATLDSGNMRSSVQSMAADTLTASALAADAVAEIAAAVGGSGSSGARTVTITVNDGTNALQNAKVRVTQGAESYLGTTNVSGVVTFNLDDATWTIAITKPGYTYAGTTLVVNGDETPDPYSMTAVTITPSSGSLVTGYWVCYSELGVVESGVSITMQATKVPADTGFALDSAVRTSTSGSDGVAQFTNLIPGATYRVQRNSGDYYTIKIDDDATGSVELNSILGT